MQQPAQDPNERFDVLDEDGNPTGITKARAQVHKDGDWHRAVHIWIYGVDQRNPFILLNQRGRNKDTFPLALDATIGGHLGAGETPLDAMREIREEVGINVDPSRCEWIFQRKRSSGALLPDLLDQEFQEVYLLRDDRPLRAYRPNYAELEGLVQIHLDAAAELFPGVRDFVEATVLIADSGEIHPLTIEANQLHVPDGDSYFVDVLTGIEDRISR